ncbi:hypothetical protein [Kineococcus sp. SYSU DK001]|uniref:hypothetical protein n=1 Tax=Kineococcus sp. SYSU DK001 TaxID=3383122 RepID=UPI003D7E356D
MDETQPLTFELADAWTEHVMHDGNLTRRPQSFFLDWVIGGVTLRAGLPGAETVVTPLNRPWLDGIAESVDVLTGGRAEADLTPGRVGIFSCVVCGEVDVSAALSVHAETVLWSNLRWERTEPESLVEGVPSTLVFERAGYEQALEGAYQRVASSPHEESEHTTRRFLWPWQWGWRLPRS